MPYGWREAVSKSTPCPEKSLWACQRPTVLWSVALSAVSSSNSCCHHQQPPSTQPGDVKQGRVQRRWVDGTQGASLLFVPSDPPSQPLRSPCGYNQSKLGCPFPSPLYLRRNKLKMARRMKTKNLAKRMIRSSAKSRCKTPLSQPGGVEESTGEPEATRAELWLLPIQAQATKT